MEAAGEVLCKVWRVRRASSNLPGTATICTPTQLETPMDWNCPTTAGSVLGAGTTVTASNAELWMSGRPRNIAW